MSTPNITYTTPDGHEIKPGTILIARRDFFVYNGEKDGKVQILTKNKSYIVKILSDEDSFLIDSDLKKDHTITFDGIPHLFYSNIEMRKFKIRELKSKYDKNR